MATGLLKGLKKNKDADHLTATDDKSDGASANRLGVTISAPNFQVAEIVVDGIAFTATDVAKLLMRAGTRSGRQGPACRG